MTVPTYFYPAILRPTAHSELTDNIGRLTEQEVVSLRQLVPSALGFGSGNCFAPGAPRDSKRGRVVAFDGETAEHLGTPFGAIVTEHHYSTHEKAFLAVVPLVIGGKAIAGEDVPVEGDVSLAPLAAGTPSAVLIPKIILSIRTQQVGSVTVLVLPNHYMSEIEQRLTFWLQLSGPPAAA